MRKFWMYLVKNDWVWLIFKPFIQDPALRNRRNLFVISRKRWNLEYQLMAKGLELDYASKVTSILIRCARQRYDRRGELFKDAIDSMIADLGTIVGDDVLGMELLYHVEANEMGFADVTDAAEWLRELAQHFQEQSLKYTREVVGPVVLVLQMRYFIERNQVDIEPPDSNSDERLPLGTAEHRARLNK